MSSRPRGLSHYWGGGWKQLRVEGFAGRCSSVRLQIQRLAGALVIACAGCVSDQIGDTGQIGAYQQTLAGQGPQERVDPRGEDTAHPLGVLEPLPPPTGEAFGKLEVTEDPATGEKAARLTIEQAVVRALANSPQIRVVSFDPAIARAEITKAAAVFDPTAFTRLDTEQNDNPHNSVFEPGQSDTRTWETGVQQRVTTGAQWSLSYAFVRRWDDLFGRTLSTRYEPLLAFQLRQPLLRDGWEQVNLAGVSIANLNHSIALTGFRQRAEEVSTQVMAAYWALVQTRRDLEVQQALLDQTAETLAKVRGREGIDATAVQIKQAEASLKLREAFLIQAQKRVLDAQDALLGLMADPQVNLVTGAEILPTTEPYLGIRELSADKLLALAMQNNPLVEQARIAVGIADINIEVAQNQAMPRLDLVASTQGRGLGEHAREANKSLERDGYTDYAVGIVLEYPLGNRERNAELYKRRLERRKAISSLHATSDQVALEVRERMRKAQTNHAEIEVERQATEAAQIQLQALQDTEEVREQLTPEFLLVELQAQQSLADARHAENRAIADYNIAIAELAQATGTVLQLHRLQTAVNTITEAIMTPETPEE
jgi:outer membrane protein